MDPTDIDDALLPHLPPAWLDAIHAWAPLVLAALVALTVLVHALLPLARRVEQWAIASAATWDDVPARRAVEVLAWLAEVSRALLAWTPRLAMGPAPFTAPSARRPPTVPLPVLLALALALASSGCGASAVGIHARAALATHHVHRGAVVAVEAAADADLDRVDREHPVDLERLAVVEAAAEAIRARPATTAAQPPTPDEAQILTEHAALTALLAARKEAIGAAAAVWRRAMLALDAIGSAILTWGQSISLAQIAASADVDLAALVPLGLRVLQLYDSLAALVRDHGVDLPALPTWITALLPMPLRVGGVA